MLARQMEVYAAFMEHTDHHVGRLIDAIDAARRARRHAGLRDRRRQRRLGRGHAQRRLQRDGQLQRDGRAGDAGVHGVGAGQVRLAGVLQPLLGRLGARDEHALPVDQAGRLALGRHPQRHDRALAERDQARGEMRDQFCHVIDVAPTVLEVAGLPHPTMVNGVMQAPIEGTRWPTASTTPQAPERHDLQYFEMFGNRGVYYKGWSAVTKHRTPWVHGRCARLPAFDDDVWELYDGTQGLDPVPRPVEGDARQAPRAPAAVADRGDQVQRAPARRPHRRAPQRRHRRPAAARPRQLAGAVRRHGPAVGDQRPEHQEQVVLGHRRGRRARRRRRRHDHRPGRALRRLGALRQGRQGGVRLQRARASSSSRPRPSSRSRRARTRCAWSSPTTAAGSRRAAT